jgi:hypothetical protein
MPEYFFNPQKCAQAKGEPCKTKQVKITPQAPLCKNELGFCHVRNAAWTVWFAMKIKVFALRVKRGSHRASGTHRRLIFSPPDCNF